MNLTTYKLIRDISKGECSWLDQDLLKGTVVYEYDGHTYGCIGTYGIACTLVPYENPFIEIPLNALEIISDQQ